MADLCEYCTTEQCQQGCEVGSPDVEVSNSSADDIAGHNFTLLQISY